MILERKRVPFVFISGSPQEELPSDLRSMPFISKPFYPAQIERGCRLSKTNLHFPGESQVRREYPCTATASRALAITGGNGLSSLALPMGTKV
jgi:hypothetical protein